MAAIPKEWLIKSQFLCWSFQASINYSITENRFLILYKMKKIISDSQLEFELQELYIESKNWLQDLSFLSDEIRFFKNMLVKYLSPDASGVVNEKNGELTRNIAELQLLKDRTEAEISDFLNYLEDFMRDSNKTISIELISKFNVLDEKVRGVFAIVKQIKSDFLAMPNQ
jgi:hypothetical protein